ncbi:fibronectin type III-like domain-contianing protein [Autumnicola psychrophila]
MEPGASEEIKFKITPEMMELVNEEEVRILEKGEFTIYI